MSSPIVESFWRRNQERLLTGALVLLLVYAVIRSVCKAAVRSFWFDELCTWIVAHQPNLSLLWRSLTHAADGQPPPFYLLERIFNHLSADDHISLRAPSILAFCLMEWCLFAWVKKRYNSAVAFVAVLFPFLMIIFDLYAIEARPYCILVACLSLALLAYQRIPALSWTIVLGLSLLAAQAFHYYAFIMSAPFFLAEAVYFLKTKTLRWRVWLALSCVFIPVLVFWPILSHFKTYYSGHYWSHPDLLLALRMYGWVIGLSQGPVSGFTWTSAAGYLLTTAGLVFSVVLIYQSLRADPQIDALFHERALLAGFLLLPIILYAASKLTAGGYTERYLLPVTIGFVMVAGLGLNYLNRKTLLLVGAALILGIAANESEFWFTYYTIYELGFSRPKPVEQLVAKSGSDLPVVISDSHDFARTAHYAAPLWEQRFNYLADPAGAAGYDRTDTGEKELLALREFAPLRVFAPDDFLPSNPRFLLFSDPKPENNPDWRVLSFAAKGCDLKSLATDGQNNLYLVECKHVE